jgi:GT2 family glycosyltransferase
MNAVAMDKSLDPANQQVAIVILNWNGGDDILDCLKSVFESNHKAIEVVIVDNGSADGSSEAIRLRFPQAHFIDNPCNLGFAKGSNQGIEWALDRQIAYVLLLNGDARVHPDTIHELLAVTEGESDAVVACPRIYLGGSNNGVNRLWFAYGTVKLWAGLFQNPAFNQVDSPKWSMLSDMEYASGCCMLIPARILQRVGMLDEAFFAYCEDVDFSLRVRKAGFRLRYVPTAYLWHGSNRPTDRTRAARYRYLATRNNLWVVRKHGSRLEILMCLCVLPLRFLFRMARMVAGAQWDSLFAELRGIRDGVFSSIEAPLGTD